MNTIRERQRAAGSTQILDLSYANLDTFPTEIEFLRDVLEKLTMSHNSIRTLPLQLNMFTSLRYLNIRANSIRIFPAVLCHLSSLEILDMSRNKISRFPDSFGNLMNLRVLSISKNRLETIPTYIGEMSQLQFLKIEQNPIVFPPAEIVDFPGEDMEGWLNSLKSYLVAHKKEHGVQPSRVRSDDHAATHQESTPLAQQRAIRSASADSLVIPHTHRQSRSEPGLRLSIPDAVERSGSQTGTLSPEPMTSKLNRTNSQHGNLVNHGDDHYRFISHSRGISGDSTSSFGSTASNDCDKYSDVYFQRLATYPPPPHPLPGERVRLVEAARGILFALSQIYRAVKQVVGCSADEKFSLLFTRLLQSANSAMTQLIQALDRFDNSAQIQVPDQSICAEIMRCCESNVVAFRKLVHMVQTQITSISLVADARLVRNLVLLLHGALSEIRMAWDSLLPLLQGSGELSVEVVEPNHPMLKDQHSYQQQQQVQQALMYSGMNHQQQQQQHHLQHQHHPQLHHQLSNGNLSMSHQPHPFQLSPTMPTSSTWLPVQIPQRSQNMSRTSNHSAQSTIVHHDEEEDTQLLMTVEHAIEAARRLIQSLTETCMTRVENLMASPQHRISPRARSVSASPPRTTGSGSSASSSHGSANGGKHSALDQQDGSTASLSPHQHVNEQSSVASSVNGESTKPSAHKVKSEAGNLIRSPLFSPVSDTVPYSNGMCLSLPINLSTSTTMTTTTTTTEMTAAAGSAVSTTHAGEDNGSTRQERRAGTHSKGSSKASFDPALPSIPQDEAHEVSSHVQTPAIATPPYQPVMTARSASVSGLPSSSQQAHSSFHSSAVVASSLPSQGFLSQGSVQSHHGSQALSVAQLPASQLWREMKECLLQMTEIVKRLDLDLTMIRTEDIHHHYQAHHSHHHGQFPPHYQQYQQNYTPHPHQASGQNSVQSQHGQHHGTGTNLDDPNVLRRRFGMGVSDFVKSVVVISTLVRQLSSTASVATTAGRSGSGSSLVGDGSGSNNSRTTTVATVTTTTTSSTTILSTSPSAPRTGSALAGDSSSLTTPTTTGATLYSSASHTNNDMATTSTPPPKSATPQSGLSISGSSSATNLGAMMMMTGSPEKMSFSMHNSSRFQPGNGMTTSSAQHQVQQHSNISGSQTEIFSRLVMTNVSNLTKITKELTIRMPRSSFRDYLLSQQTFGSSSSSSAAATVAMASGVTGGSHFGTITSAGGGVVPNGTGGGAAVAAHGGSSGGYGYSFGYGPAAASILAMRKGSLI
ncbi:RAM signaling network component [Mortierella sp. 14UC]|nr:RAM signaling network component [Mortierella sp. 14UC]